MEYESVGKLIQSLRKEKGLTQKQLADMLNITDKAVSKWERDVACPDTTTLPKLADILGVTVEALLNAKTDSLSVAEENVTDDLNPLWECYLNRFRQLVRQGIPGFILGSILMIIAIIAFGSGSSITGEDLLGMIIGMPIMIIVLGLIFAGFPYGWSLINKFLGQWSIFGSIPVLIFLFGLKFAFSLWIGMIAYPIVLIYNLIRSQKTKRKVRVWTIVVISVVVLWYAFIGIYTIIDTKSNAGMNGATDSTGTAVVQTVDVDSFSDQDALVNEVCQNALNITKEDENECANYGWTIIEPSQIHGVFFLESKDPENPHYNVLKKLDLSNAVVVVTGYFLGDAGITINQWEMDVTFYPNFTFSENNSLIYENDRVYSDSIRSDGMEDIMEWLSSEYDDMNITEIVIS